MVRVRHAVSFNPIWDDTLKWYELAVAEMRKKPVTDKTSWLYQAAIHNTELADNHPGWRTCQHGGWFFFPWHRAYLAGFEAIVRKVIKGLHGPADWSLPYWNYELPASNALPPAFRAPKRPDGKDNALFSTSRLKYVNNGLGLSQLLQLLGPTATLSSTKGVHESTFSTGPANGFGGGPGPSSPFQNSVPSDIESFLHGNVHVLVGGNAQPFEKSWMSHFETAAKDPIFWLHHANLDRLWAEWAAKAPHKNPTANAWLTQVWTFINDSGGTVPKHPSDVVNNITSLDYTYDTLPVAAPHVPAPPGPVGVDAGHNLGVVADDGDDAVAAEQAAPDLRLVGASDAVVLSGGSTTVPVDVDRPTFERANARAAVGAVHALGAPAPRSYLELSGIDAPQVPGVLYGVYIHPHGTTEAAVADHLVGVISFFGVGNHPKGDDQHDHKLRYVFDVTDAVDGMNAVGNVGTEGFAVTFRPLDLSALDEEEGLDAAAEPPPPAVPVSIGRVALLVG